ncbi:Unknown protein [Striga hermonthica]|uniref:Uncharacterized protein n=1 Tax=Striga hermonthica TaxID=68872 RepID=A0A9N7N5H4_STRHE|nr:Unknown protein [Striga hermonthica]
MDNSAGRVGICSPKAKELSYIIPVGMKVKERAAKFTVDYVNNYSVNNYHASTPAPSFLSTTSVFGGMFFSCLVALPEERRHLEHQQHAKEHGGH